MARYLSILIWAFGAGLIAALIVQLTAPTEKRRQVAARAAVISAPAFFLATVLAALVD